MLQLPDAKKMSATDVIKSGRLKGLPNVKPYNCPVLALAGKYEDVLAECDKADVPGNPDFAALGRLGRKMDRIAERASWLSPKSFEGAAFQIMLASAQPGLIAHGTTEDIKREATKRIQRLLYRALERLDVGAAADTFPLTRACHVPERCDQRIKSQQGAL
ncbi:hypothetical protein [Tardiphaga sp.]|uniref:hypothetical protein n=1 Tax=Tardiphaga sp. TaxID=1926292 RepID=UPI002602A47A|nr:hypothetical protein [Tardiphaga sp.]MDB5621068.1 hypothetical protein [Tardiphaga sp.]